MHDSRNARVPWRSMRARHNWRRLDTSPLITRFSPVVHASESTHATIITADDYPRGLQRTTRLQIRL